MDVKGGMGNDPLQHIDEGGIGSKPLQAAGGNQALDNADIPCAHFCPAEEPVMLAHSNGANLALQMIRIQQDVEVFQKAFQGRLAL